MIAERGDAIISGKEAEEGVVCTCEMAFSSVLKEEAGC